MQQHHNFILYTQSSLSMISLSRVFEPSNWKTSSTAFRAHNTISLGKSWVNSVAKQELKTGTWIKNITESTNCQRLLSCSSSLSSSKNSSMSEEEIKRTRFYGQVCHVRNRSAWNLISLESLLGMLGPLGICRLFSQFFPTPPKPKKKNNNNQESNHNRLKSPKFSPTATQLKSLPHLQKLDRLPKSFQKVWRFCLGDLIPKKMLVQAITPRFLMLEQQWLRQPNGILYAWTTIVTMTETAKWWPIQAYPVR